MCNMSTFLSMFDPGVTRQHALMPHRCKYCPRFFHKFQQLRCHMDIHRRVYKKHQGQTGRKRKSRARENYLCNVKKLTLNGCVMTLDGSLVLNTPAGYHQQSAIKIGNNRVCGHLTGHDETLFKQSNSFNNTHPRSPNRNKHPSDQKLQPPTSTEVSDGSGDVIKIKQEIVDDCDTGVDYSSAENDMRYYHGSLPQPLDCSIGSDQQDPSNYDSLVDLDPSKYYFSSATPYRCVYCSKSFSKSSNRLIHQRAHLKDPFPWVCKECSKKFRSRVALEVHTRVHTGEKPYKCPYCESHFSTKGYLNVHVRGHTGEMPYQCEFCQKSFRESCKLKVHRRTHTMEKPYKCRFCDNTFSQRGNARKHERIHTGEKPYKCCHCDKEYTNFRNFNRHEMTHTGVAPYRCEYCDVSFKFRRSLKTHEKIHTGGNVFVCAQCNGAYSSPSNLKKHRKDVHYSRNQTD